MIHRYQVAGRTIYRIPGSVVAAFAAVYGFALIVVCFASASYSVQERAWSMAVLHASSYDMCMKQFYGSLDSAMWTPQDVKAIGDQQ